MGMCFCFFMDTFSPSNGHVEDGLASSVLTSSRWFQFRDVEPEGFLQETLTLENLVKEMPCRFKNDRCLGCDVPLHLPDSHCLLAVCGPCLLRACEKTGLHSRSSKFKHQAANRASVQEALQCSEIFSKNHIPKRNGYVGLQVFRKEKARKQAGMVVQDLYSLIFCVLSVICPQPYLRSPWPETSVLPP